MGEHQLCPGVAAALAGRLIAEQVRRCRSWICLEVVWSSPVARELSFASSGSS